jgi:hypothetical protein
MQVATHAQARADLEPTTSLLPSAVPLRFLLVAALPSPDCLLCAGSKSSFSLRTHMQYRRSRTRERVWNCNEVKGERADIPCQREDELFLPRLQILPSLSRPARSMRSQIRCLHPQALPLPWS